MYFLSCVEIKTIIIRLLLYKNQVTCEFSAVCLKRSDRNGCRKLPVMNKKERSPIMLKELEIFYHSSKFVFNFTGA